MSAATEKEVHFSLKVMMHRESNKVLYSEIDSHFADVLLSFLTLPLGTIVRLLVKNYGDNAPILGSLSSLYAGLLNLDGSHFWTEAGKLMLLNPRNSSGDQCSRLKLQIDDTPPIQYFVCNNASCVNMYYKVKCLCGNSTDIIKLCKDSETKAQSGGESVFTVQTSSFLLTDDLQILPNSPTSLLRCLKQSGIEDTSVLEERTLIVGFEEIFELLKGSLASKTPLTDIILHSSSATSTPKRRKRLCASVNYEPEALPQTQTSKNTGSDSKITVKALVQKSTYRVLFAQTWQDFVDFLFSLLTIPLARVQLLLGDNNCLGSIYNLYRSTYDLETVKYIKSTETVTRLLEPNIPPYYLSCYQIFSLSQQRSPASNRGFAVGKGRSFKASPSSFSCSGMNVIDPKGQGSFVKGPTMFMVTDDLVVSSPSPFSIISTLNSMKIPVSDVEEHELDIGMEETLRILQATLTSTSALTNGLKPFLKRETKQ
ncbi:uncharacterized protein [Henckelia pumila]|uniref:uncharacterized protein n=1 Tax=Henckelia pumila TaxID=405737 RepID=UPI003C6E44EE